MIVFRAAARIVNYKQILCGESCYFFMKVNNIPDAWKAMFKAAGIKKSQLKDKAKGFHYVSIANNI